MKNNVTKTASLNGITFEYLTRDCGDLIVIKGKSGFVYSTDEVESVRRKQQPGVYHSVSRKSVQGVDANFPYDTQVDTILPGITAEEFRAALNLR